MGHFIAGLERLGIRDTTTLIVVSDHGMAEVGRSQSIDLNGLLSGLDTVALQWSGPVAGFVVAPSERETALNRLAGESHMTCWPKSEIPQRLHLGSHRRVPDVVCLAQVGWTITDGRPFPPGQHGYDPAEPDMWGLFVAVGPGIAVRKLELVDNIDVYPLLCRLLGVPPETNDASNALADALVR